MVTIEGAEKFANRQRNAFKRYFNHYWSDYRKWGGPRSFQYVLIGSLCGKDI